MNPEKDSIKSTKKDSEITLGLLDREIQYAQEKILLAPQNQSPWNYLRGALGKKGKGLGEVKAFAEQFANLNKEDDVRSSHALDLLADIYAQEQKKDMSGKALELLARRYDPIRRNYWNYRRSLLGLAQVEA